MVSGGRGTGGASAGRVLTAPLCSSRWEEERYTDGVKWKFLEHKGPVFAPPYEPLPSNVRFYYDGGSPSTQQRLLCRWDVSLIRVFFFYLFQVRPWR